LVELSYLESDSDSVSFNREVETALLVVNRGEIAVDNSVLDIKSESTLVRTYCAIENSCFFEHVAEVDKRVEKGDIELDGLFEVVNCEPDVSTLVVNAAQVAVSNCKGWIALDGFLVAFLEAHG
jgi:hypothetical protein